MSRYPSHRSPRSLLGARAGAPAPALRANPPRPSTPHSLRQFRRDQRRLREERIARRNYALAKKLNLLPPEPPRRRRHTKPAPIAVTGRQVAKEQRQRKLRTIWDDMEETGTDRIDLTPRTGGPTWDEGARPKSTPARLGSPRISQSRSAGTPPAGQIASPAPQPLPAPPDATPYPRIRSRNSYVASDAEREATERLIAHERQRLDDRRRIHTSVTAFRSQLTAGQLAAGIADDFDPYALALHDRLFGWRHGRFER